jgi:membrane protein implicated in regulation of membrane protease activity
VNARALVPLAAGHVLALWELADAEPDPTNVAFSTFGGLSWTAGAPLFSGTTAQSANDWDVVHLTDTNVRVVRRALAGGFDDVRFDGSTWSALAAPTGDPGLAGSGVVLLGSAPRVAAFTIAGDAANSVRQAVWNGASWGPWTTLEGTPAARRFLSGWSSAGHAAVIWTQADGAGFDVAGKLVTF